MKNIVFYVFMILTCLITGALSYSVGYYGAKRDNEGARLSMKMDINNKFYSSRLLKLKRWKKLLEEKRIEKLRDEIDESISFAEMVIRNTNE